jgi:phage gp16-like protein
VASAGNPVSIIRLSLLGDGKLFIPPTSNNTERAFPAAGKISTFGAQRGAGLVENSHSHEPKFENRKNQHNAEDFSDVESSITDTVSIGFDPVEPQPYSRGEKPDNKVTN